MKIKAIAGFLLLVFASFMLLYMKPSRGIYYGILPVIMLAYPVLAGHRVKISFTVKDILTGLVASFVILLPYYLFFGRNPENITFAAALFQLTGIAFPEEFFFRGFIQDSMKRNLKSVFLASLLFAAAHLPNAFMHNDWTSLLSFFPSLIMGWLYLKTNNILPGTIFHFLANMVYQG